jgi:hypothetical protein
MFGSRGTRHCLILREVRVAMASSDITAQRMQALEQELKRAEDVRWQIEDGRLHRDKPVELRKQFLHRAYQNKLDVLRAIQSTDPGYRALEVVRGIAHCEGRMRDLSG